MEQKTVLITGASGGIGREAARRFAARGYAVAMHYHSGEGEALRLAEELSAGGHRVLPIRADLRSGEEAGEMLDNVLAEFCQLDILICNAGLAWQGLLTDMTDREWREVFAVNVDAVFHCCRAAIPHFVHRKAGKIITVSSMWGQVGASCEVAYSAAKAAVIGLTKGLAKELGPSGITVNCVSPGLIQTGMNRRLDPQALEELRLETPLERIGTPADVAESLLFLASPAADFLTGQVLAPNGGLVI